MRNILDTDGFVTEVAKKARFTKEDVKIILDTFIKVFEESARNNVVLKLRRFGKLYQSYIPARKGVKGIDLPPTHKITFRLAENIRYPFLEENIEEE